MGASSLGALAAIWRATSAKSGGGGAAQPSPTIGLLLQGAGLGTCVGTLVAYHRRRGDPSFDTFPIIVRWTVVGLVGALLYALGVALVDPAVSRAWNMRADRRP